MAKCVWAEDMDGNWDTSCHHTFVFTQGGPDDNGMKFCCFCGLRLNEERYKDEDGE